MYYFCLQIKNGCVIIRSMTHKRELFKMEFLRTPDERFANLPDYDFEPHYAQINGARMHYIDTGIGDETLVMLHGEPSWSFLYRHMINDLKDSYRCIAPDLLGFGRSDKPTEISDHTFDFHYKALSDWLTQLDLKDITLIVQDWGGILGIPLAIAHEDRIKRIVIMNTGLATGDIDLGEGFLRWQAFARKVGMRLEAGSLIGRSAETTLSKDVIAAYDSPFPERSYRAGVAAMPLIVPSMPDMAGAAQHRAARERLKTWDKPALVLFSDKDPITSAAGPYFRKLIPTAQDNPEAIIEGAGHFLQEEAGAEIANHIRTFIERTS